MKITFISSSDDSFSDAIERIFNLRAYNEPFIDFMEAEEASPMEEGGVFVDGVFISANGSDDFTVYLDVEKTASYGRFK